ncbi:MAG TPA: type II toxin-antitoxin system Phd/YefM family antitoxin [Blastocatellia bacterium]|nr:type II toxin-antitoxin system Phd/YefM family antitoxin [Blastocatellia bacterium]
MQRVVLDQDVKPISEFRANAASLVQQVQRTRRPLVITQQGRSAAVLLAVSEYEKLLAKLELLQDIHIGEAQIDGGQGITHSTARKKALERRRHGKQRLPLEEIK